MELTQTRGLNGNYIYNRPPLMPVKPEEIPWKKEEYQLSIESIIIKWNKIWEDTVNKKVTCNGVLTKELAKKCLTNMILKSIKFQTGACESALKTRMINEDHQKEIEVLNNIVFGFNTPECVLHSSLITEQEYYEIFFNRLNQLIAK